MGRPKGGARSGKKKPNFKRSPDKCKCGPAGVGLAFAFALDALCQEVPDPDFPDDDGNCPDGTCPVTRTFLFFEWVQCLPCS
jgi:hypothetical protein